MKLYKLSLGICLVWLCFIHIATAQTKPGEVFKDCPDCPEMVVIPAGSFLMGSDPQFENGVPEKQEYPQHKVKIQSFAIGKYEVTQQQWVTIMGKNPSKNKARTNPVENVSSDDVQLFIQKLSQKTGKNYRLPTEAEWEYAARAGSNTNYFWGDSHTEVNIYAFVGEEQTTQPVGLKKPNQFGLYDIYGNVWEWTQDCGNENYIGAPTDGSAWKKGDCNRRMIRGGYWRVDLVGFRSLHSAFRHDVPLTIREGSIGFRLAITL